MNKMIYLALKAVHLYFDLHELHIFCQPQTYTCSYVTSVSQITDNGFIDVITKESLI